MVDVRDEVEKELDDLDVCLCVCVYVSICILGRRVCVWYKGRKNKK